MIAAASLWLWMRMQKPQPCCVGATVAAQAQNPYRAAYVFHTPPLRDLKMYFDSCSDFLIPDPCGSSDNICVGPDGQVVLPSFETYERWCDGPDNVRILLVKWRKALTILNRSVKP